MSIVRYQGIYRAVATCVALGYREHLHLSSSIIVNNGRVKLRYLENYSSYVIDWIRNLWNSNSTSPNGASRILNTPYTYDIEVRIWSVWHSY